jgi:hypothetical protein
MLKAVATGSAINANETFQMYQFHAGKQLTNKQKVFKQQIPV